MIENFAIFDCGISVLLIYAKAGDLKKSTRFQIEHQKSKIVTNNVTL